MAIIRFALDDRLDAMGAPPDNIALEEKATHCDGSLCGARPEIEDRNGRSLEDTPEYIARFGRGPVPEHAHMVSSRNHPELAATATIKKSSDRLSDVVRLFGQRDLVVSVSR